MPTFKQQTFNPPLEVLAGEVKVYYFHAGVAK